VPPLSIELDMCPLPPEIELDTGPPPPEIRLIGGTSSPRHVPDLAVRLIRRVLAGGVKRPHNSQFSRFSRIR
jgi:hypothetical protein